MSFQSEANSTYVNGSPVAKSDVRALWGDVDDVVTTLNRLGVIPLTNIGGTANAITADMASGTPVASLNANSTVSFTPSASNTASPVTLFVAGDQARPLRGEDGGDIPVGYLKASRFYIAQRFGANWKIISGGATFDDLVAISAILDGKADASTIAAALNVVGVVPLINVAGTGDAITADMAVNAVNAGMVIAGNALVEFRPVATNENSSPRITISQDEVERFIQPEDGGSMPAGYLVPGRAYLLRRVGSVWRVQSGGTTRADIVALLAAVSGKADLANAGKIFPTRAAAVAAGQSALPAALSRILTREGDYLVLRGQGITGDDPLFPEGEDFPTGPRWGVVDRYPAQGLLDQEVEDRMAIMREAEIDDASMILVTYDAAGNAIWPGWARATDGQWPEWLVAEMQPRLTSNVYGDAGLMRPADDDLLIIGTYDRDGNAIWPGYARASDGQWPDWLFAEFVDRLSPYIGGAAAEEDPPVWDGSAAWTRARSDLTRVAVIGSSTPAQMAGELASIFADLAPAYGGAAVTALTNDAQGGERSQHTAARLGAIPALLTVAGDEIPASGSVLVSASNMPASSFLKAYAGLLAGVQGTLSWSAGDGSFSFARSASGAAVAVDPDTPFIPTLGPTLRERFFVISTGKNDLTTGGAGNLPAEVNVRIAAIVDYLSARDKRFSIWTDFCNTGWTAETWMRQRVLDCNAEKLATWGPMVFDQNAYILSSQIWDDAAAIPPEILSVIAPGWTGPDTEDLDEQSAGNKPASISTDAGHYNALGRYLVAHEFRRWLTDNRFYREL